MSAIAIALDENDIAAYRRDGQVTPSQSLPDELVAEIREALAEQIELFDGRPDFIPLPHAPPAAGDKRSVALARRFFNIVTAPALLDLVEQVIGPDIVMWASAVFCKPAATGLEVPWHQDGQYWPIRPRATVTAWIALDDVDRDNGCMRVIPGSQRMGEFAHDVSDREDLVLSNVLNDPRIDLENIRDITLRAGQLSLHDVNIVHGSQPNTSGRRRAGWMPANSRTVGRMSACWTIVFERRPARWG